jgi:hypothetical protein
MRRVRCELSRARGVVVAPDPSKVLAPVRARSGALPPAAALDALSNMETAERARARRQREVENYWLELLGLSETSLCRSVVSRVSRSSSGKRVKRLPYGTCRVVVNRTDVVQSFWGAIQEYAGFRRDAWLE